MLRAHPTHYGATFQLATALDAAGKPRRGGLLWEKMLQLADAAHDAETTAKVRARLQSNP